MLQIELPSGVIQALVGTNVLTAGGKRERSLEGSRPGWPQRLNVVEFGDREVCHKGQGFRPKSEVQQEALCPGVPVELESARRGFSSVGWQKRVTRVGNLMRSGWVCGPRTGHRVWVEGESPQW